jgi:hypothetical protein
MAMVLPFRPSEEIYANAGVPCADQTTPSLLVMPLVGPVGRKVRSRPASLAKTAAQRPEVRVRVTVMVMLVIPPPSPGERLVPMGTGYRA